MTKKQKRALGRILTSTVLLVVSVVLTRLPGYPHVWYAELPLFLLAYLPVGLPILKKAAVNIAHGQIFDENFLMAFATLGAFAIGFLPGAEEPQYAEGVFVMLFYQVGELFENIAVGKSRKSISDLMNIRPDSACVERDGGLITVSPDEVAVGEILVVKPGEKIPLDGVILEGKSSLNTVALTGESAPREAATGDEVLSGCVNLSGVLRIRVTKPFGESTVSKILCLVEEAGSNKSRSENFITKFSKYYTPAVVAGAVLVAILPPLLIPEQTFATWILRALEFLIISCPCALVISVPLSFFGGIGGASRAGILIKGSNYMETLANCRTVVFDKTGTLTKGNFRVSRLSPQAGVSQEELLETAALAEGESDHPVARSLREAWGKPVDLSRLSQAEELSGRGIRVKLDGNCVLAGNQLLMEQEGIVPASAEGAVGTVVHVARNGKYLGYLLISDEIKPDATEAIRALKSAGVRQTVMLTGDRREVGKAVAETLGLDEYRAELMPADKVLEVERLLNQRGSRETLAFVGDGINDAPVLTRADVGIAMGALGSDAAIEAADVVLMDDNPSGVVKAIRFSRRTLRIVRQNIVFSLAVKLIVLVLCAVVGIPMTLAVFADVGVLVLAILNAMRALKMKG